MNVRNFTAFMVVVAGVGLPVRVSAEGQTPSFAIPPVTTGLQAWFRADSGVIGSPSVTQWLDSSGQGHNATVNSASPIATTATINSIPGVPVVRFNGGNQSLSFTLPGAGSYSGWSVITVASPGPTISNYEVLVGNNVSVDPGGRWALPTMGNDGVFGRGWAGSGSLGLGSFAFAPNTFYIEAYIKTKGPTSTWTSYVDGGSPIVVNDFNNFISGNFNGVIGDERASSSLYPLTGDIAEIMIFDHALTPAEHNQVGTYLAQKYGFNIAAYNFEFVVTPEPATMILWGACLFVGIGAWFHRQRRQQPID